MLIVIGDQNDRCVKIYLAEIGHLTNNGQEYNYYLIRYKDD